MCTEKMCSYWSNGSCVEVGKSLNVRESLQSEDVSVGKTSGLKRKLANLEITGHLQNSTLILFIGSFALLSS